MALFGRKEPEPVIDLRDPRPQQRFGYPTPCPDCGANGYLDSIDVAGRVMFQHCPDCLARWETAEQDLISS
jgi:hypothetical protein